MSIDVDKIIRPGIKDLHPYIPGKPVEDLERELGISNAAKLASNENPLGPSQLAIEAIAKYRDAIHIYPDGDCYNLKQALAKRLNVNAKQITIGNGSNEIIELVSRLFIGPGIDVVVSQYSFAIYALVAQALNANCIQVPAKQWGHDLDAMLAAINENTKMVFIANPNNPTGTYVSASALKNFLSNIPNQVIVVLDEAYFEYVEHEDYPDGISLLSEYDNLVVMRTFSKIYGLAGLRIGYGVSSVKIADYLNRIRQPFNVNQLAQQSALAALTDEQHVQHSISVNKAGMQQLETGLQRLGLDTIPSVGNFISFAVDGDAQTVYEALLRKAVIVRPMASYKMPQHLRVTIGTVDQNQQFLQALSEVVG